MALSPWRELREEASLGRRSSGACANDHSPGCVRGVCDPCMRLRSSRPMAGGPREEAGNEEEFRCDWEGTRAKASLRGPRRDRDLLRAPLARGLASEPPERRPCPTGRVRARPASFALEASRFPGCKRSICEAKERSREARSPRHRRSREILVSVAARGRSSSRRTQRRHAERGRRTSASRLSRTCTRRNGAEKLSPARHAPVSVATRDATQQ